MRVSCLVVAAVLAAAVPVVAFAQGSETLTPEGPATLYSDWHGGQTDEGLSPMVLTGFRVTVAPGGRAGTVRLRAFSRETGIAREAAPVTLPAEPGTYTFPAPHIAYDYRDVTLGLDQETGGHAIAAQIRCDPGEGDVCDAQSVDVYRPVVGDGVRPDRRLAEVQRGGKLTIDAVSEPDSDQDLAGDKTEDRTNLRATISTQRIGGRRLAVTITIENAGPRAADLPRVQVSFSPPVGLGRWERPCGPRSFFGGGLEDEGRQRCTLAPLAVGETRALRLVVPDPGRTDVSASVEAEGPDLASGDESDYEELQGKRPPLVLETDPRPRINGGIGVKVRSTRAGSVRLRLATGSRVWIERRLRFRRAGSRELLLRVPRGQWSALGSRVMTLTARSRTASARAELEPSY